MNPFAEMFSKIKDFIVPTTATIGCVVSVSYVITELSPTLHDN